MEKGDPFPSKLHRLALHGCPLNRKHALILCQLISARAKSPRHSTTTEVCRRMLAGEPLPRCSGSGSRVTAQVCLMMDPTPTATLLLLRLLLKLFETSTLTATSESWQ